MDRISRFFIRRLRHLARREARRNALLHGLIGCWMVEEGGHMLRLYGPAFDTSGLTGDLDRDLVWFRRRFGSPPVGPLSLTGPKPGVGVTAGITVEDAAARTPAIQPPATLVPYRQRKGRTVQGRVPESSFDRRSHAVRLVSAAAEPLSVSQVVTALLLARAVRQGARPLRDVVQAIKHATPVVALHAPVGGFEREVSRLLEKSCFVPGGPFAMIDGDYMFNDDYLDVQDAETRRRIVVFRGKGVHRGNGDSLRRRLVGAIARDLPVVAIAEKRTDIPEALQISADATLTTGWLDQAFLGDVVEALYPDAALEGLGLPADWDAYHLSLEDIILAFRPGRAVADALIVLDLLAKRNREDAEDEEEGNDGERKASSARSKGSDKKTEKPANPSDLSKPKSSESDNSGRWKKDKPSGTEIIQPEPQVGASSGDEAKRAKPPLTVETLSGYGKAKSWALDLKADLADYDAGRLDWTDMSSRLLLYGPPGTGKTTFARALCNTLQTPLVVTSVSTWLQGGHLNDVIDKMVKTFAEAKAMAPCILFVDEIDGIGKRQPAEREHADYWNTVVNKCLELLDGAVKSEGVIVIGATNRPEDIDEAIKRSGRLETHIEIPKPDVPTLAEILAHHLGSDLEAVVADVGLDRIGGSALEPTVGDRDPMAAAADDEQEAGRRERRGGRS